ncbi:MAG TPA: dynamin family protein, partial [Chloroflexota bacterium]|nr:dynamin family protein [Chloroflexota bacterium]
MADETISTNLGANVGLKEVLGRAREQLAPRALGAVDGLRAVATGLEMKETAARLGQVRQRFDSDTFNIIVLGRFKNGKSTFLNALLGRPTQDVPELAGTKGPMPIDDLPCTACLTSIRYADKPYVRIWRFDGKSEDWSLARYLRESTIHDDEKENVKAFQNIREFEVGFPAELCKSGVTL